MTTCNFLFDAVVSHFESAAVKDIAKVKIVIQFNNKPITITSSSINITEFKPNRGIEFTVLPKKLRKTIEECGMPITVSYGPKVIGAGQIGFPQMVIDRIEDGMTDMMHVDSCNFEKDGEVLGKLEVLCRLVIKCDEPKPEENLFCRNMDKSINQQDIMFVMSESQRCPSPCDPCLDLLEPEEGDERLRLDIDRYRSSTAGGLRPPDTFIHNPAGNAACCQIKKMVLECEEIVNSITKSAGLSLPMKPPCRGPEDSNNYCSGPPQYLGDELPSFPPYVPCFSYLPARQAEKPDFCSPELIPVPISDKDKPMIKPSRFCPICLTNMSWLPKFAACPKCGVKPMPVVEDRHKEKKLTPDSILMEYLGKSSDVIGDYCVDPCDKATETAADTECRCTCKFGKLCAHCRIRQLCKDIFQATKNIPPCPKAKPKSSEDFCVFENNTTECRPYLARVFSELRDMYDLKDTKRLSELEKQQSEQITTSNKKPLQNDAILGEKSKINSVEDRERPSRPHKPPERTMPIFAAGHKFCLPQHGAVSRRHGWAWFRREEAHKHGWRPGSVRKSVKKIMHFFLQYSPENNAFNKCKKEQEAAKELERQLPTLNVSKKNGEILITLRALNNPNVEMKPIVFKVIKSDLAVTVREIKKKLKEKGFRKCTCHQTLMMCVCRDNMEKKQLEHAVAQESRRHGIENCAEHLVLTDTSDSEMEFDFDVTPPAGVTKPPCRPKRLTVNNGTQTVKKDLKVTPTWPVKLNPFWRSYDCAAGDRYTGTAFGAPGEAPFEDGVFGFRGGGPHGASAVTKGKHKVEGIWGGAPGGPMRGGGRAAAATGGGGGGGGAGGGRGGPGGGGGGGGFGGKSFPGAKPVPGQKVKSEPIPVRMPARHYKAIAEGKKAEKEAVKAAVEKKKRGPDMLSYLMKKGDVPTPWDPNNPQPKDVPKEKPGPVVGSDGMTDQQRKRCALRMGPIPPLDTMPRLGKGCTCHPCHYESCYPCYYCN